MSCDLSGFPLVSPLILNLVCWSWESSETTRRDFLAEPLCFPAQVKGSAVPGRPLQLRGHACSGQPTSKAARQGAPSKSACFSALQEGVLRQIDWIFFFFWPAFVGPKDCPLFIVKYMVWELSHLGMQFPAFLLLVCSSQMKTPRLFCSCRPAAFLLYHGSDYVTLGPQVKFRPLTLT